MPARRLRTALVAVGLLVTVNGPLLFFAGRVIDRPGFPPPWEDAFVRPFLLVFATATVVVVGRLVTADAIRELPRLNKALAATIAAFPLWAVASSLWGERPELTFWRSLIYIALVFLSVAVAALDDREFVAAVAATAALCVGASIVVVVARPDLGLHRDDFWQGIFTNPNSLGPVAALGMLAGVGWMGTTTARAGRLTGLGLAAASAVALYQTTSRTSWFALVLAAGAATTVVGTRQLTDRRGRRRALIVTVPLATVGTIATVAVLATRWDDPTLAQRRTIWSGATDFIDDRWLQGYGFFSFFEVPGRSTAHEFFDRGSAHSSFVEIWLGLGIVGLALFVAIFAAAAIGSTRAAWERPDLLAWSRYAIIVFLLTVNVTESFVLWFSYNWVILCAAALRPPGGVRLKETAPRSAEPRPSRPTTTR